MLQDVTTKAEYYTCNRPAGGATGGGKSHARCNGETGFYLNPDKRCRTFENYGQVPELNKEGASVVCTKPGRLTDIFKVSSELTDLSFLFVDEDEMWVHAQGQLEH